MTKIIDTFSNKLKDSFFVCLLSCWYRIYYKILKKKFYIKLQVNYMC